MKDKKDMVERALGIQITMTILASIVAEGRLLFTQSYLVCAAMIAYKTVSGTQSFKKLVHLTLQLLAFCLSVVGIWAALKFHNDKGIDNFYSLHSWLGLACILLFGIQVKSTLLSFMFAIAF